MREEEKMMIVSLLCVLGDGLGKQLQRLNCIYQIVFKRGKERERASNNGKSIQKI